MKLFADRRRAQTETREKRGLTAALKTRRFDAGSYTVAAAVIVIAIAVNRSLSSRQEKKQKAGFSKLRKGLAKFLLRKFLHQTSVFCRGHAVQFALAPLVVVVINKLLNSRFELTISFKAIKMIHLAL